MSPPDPDRSSPPLSADRLAGALAPGATPTASKAGPHRLSPTEIAALNERVDAAVQLLTDIVGNRALLIDLDETRRHDLLRTAGMVSRPQRTEQRRLSKAFRKRDKRDRRDADNQLLANTGLRQGQLAPVFKTPLGKRPPLELGQTTASAAALLSESASSGTEPVGDDLLHVGELRAPRRCYVCKIDYQRVHHFYASMCPSCAELNWLKREQSADLRGRVALVTGARVKIGYQAAVKLLRAGAHVIVLTRFARDAAARYAREPDFSDWGSRLEIHGIDLRHTPSVEHLCRQLLASHTRLDFIINNACQTVRRPPGYYGHLVEAEAAARNALPAETQRALRRFDESAGIVDAVELSQLELAPGDAERGVHLFPKGALDQDLQQVDLRSINSWRLTLADVSAVELLEVHLVNAVAPFILNARLKPLMLAVPSRDKHIVNVSAMEGQFYRYFKTDKHPHTNMAKAALNMLTRTSAQDYVKDGIHMNSVDTGWVTDEDPAAIATRKAEEHDFFPPLDIVDGAARIVAPIFDGLNTGQHVWGQFLKDYAPTDW